MTPTRKLLGAGAFSLALAGGGLAGAVLGTPTLTSAQDASAESEVAPDGRPGHHKHRGERLAVAAEAVGMTVDELEAELRDGKSIADVAEANDVDLDTVIDALVADGMARLQEAEETLPERVAEMVNRTGWGDGRPDRPSHRGGMLRGLETAAEAIGVTPEELKDALRDGRTIAEVAEANDVDLDTVIGALVSEASERLDQAVEDGKLTEERAEAMRAELTERITAFLNGERPDRRGPRVGDALRDAD